MQILLRTVRIIFIIFILVAIIFLAYIFLFHRNTKSSPSPISINIHTPNNLLPIDKVNPPSAETSPLSGNQNNASPLQLKSMVLDVPFTSQAPLNNWSDPIYQNGCEEASSLMAMMWVQDKTIAPDYANQEIKNISNYEVKTIGTYTDTSVDDTAKFMEGYFNYQNIQVKKNINANDIKQELMQGHVVIVPAFGQAVGNPHYTQPGPVEHMLVIIGYNALTNEFITNDSGTKFGKGYTYPESRIMNAIWSYPTSSQPVSYPGSANAKKDMIIVIKS
jgi:hypothetical protein